MEQHDVALSLLQRGDEWRAVGERRPHLGIGCDRRIGKYLAIDLHVVRHGKATKWTLLVERSERLRRAPGKRTSERASAAAQSDGQQLVTDWYRRTLGTQWEGGPLPWLYHPYVGHDNNRDWYMVTQKETRLVTDLLYRRWWPEIVYDVHQMGSGGMRIFVPPMVDPINPNLDPVIVRGISLIGAHMAFALEQAGKSGVGDGISYDLWWHGGMRGTPTRHNMIGLLTEAASVRVATPIQQEASSLSGHSRGLPKYEQRVNFPNPWPGGWWRLRDIVDYELIAAEALVQLASGKRADFVRGFVDLGRRQIAFCGRKVKTRRFHSVACGYGLYDLFVFFWF